MKIIPFILALIIVTQVAIPCCAESACHESMKSEIPVDKEHDDSEGYCSSLCCGVNFMIDKTNTSLSSEPVTKTPYLFSYHFVYSFDFLQAIWHPPKF